MAGKSISSGRGTLVCSLTEEFYLTNLLFFSLPPQGNCYPNSSTMIAPSLTQLAQLPLMKTYSTEELHKIQTFLLLLDGTMSEGLEWILENKDYGLRHRMKIHAVTREYGQALEHLARDQPNPNSKVQYADLQHGPDELCRIVLLLSYPTVSARVRPMMLNLRGQFVEPSLAVAAEPWVYILHYMGYNIEYCIKSPASSTFAPSAVNLIGLRMLLQGEISLQFSAKLWTIRRICLTIFSLSFQGRKSCALLLVPLHRKPARTSCWRAPASLL